MSLDNNPTFIETCYPKATAFLENNFLHIFLFVASLLGIMAISIPGLLINDSWITVNQLHQLTEGHQVILSEGKYGTFVNGTPFTYFEMRNNVLMYSLMLPLASLPSLFGISLWGDFFGYAIIALWTCLAIFIIYGIQHLYPQYASNDMPRHFRILKIFAMVLVFVLFFYNLFLFNPERWLPGTAPFETAAVIFTNHLLFASFVVITFATCKDIFERTSIALLCTAATICCSSWIIWAGAGKDHMLVGTLVALLVLLTVRHIKNGKDAYLYAAFFMSGLVAWARPDVGLATTAALLIWTGYTYFTTQLGKEQSRSATYLLSPLFTAVGALPFFVNNIITTGQPLVPVYFLKYSLDSENAIGTDTSGQVSDAMLDTLLYSYVPGTLPSDVIQSVTTFLQNAAGIFFDPASGSMGLLGADPLILVGIVLVFYLLATRTAAFSPSERNIIIFAAVLSLCTLLVFTYRFSGLNHSHGIVPDMRYLSPLYIPGSIFGLLMLRPVLTAESFAHSTLKNMLYLFPVLLPALLLPVILQPIERILDIDTSYFTKLILGLASIVIVLTMLAYRKKIPVIWLSIPLAVLILLPLIWQIDMLIYYGCRRFSGYDFWIPFINHYYEGLCFFLYGSG